MRGLHLHCFSRFVQPQHGIVAPALPNIAGEDVKSKRFATIWRCSIYSSATSPVRLFATADFERGAVVGYARGLFAVSHHALLTNLFVISPCCQRAASERRTSAWEAIAGLLHCMGERDHLIFSKQCPMDYAHQTRKDADSNIAAEIPEEAALEPDKHGAFSSLMVPVKCTKAIKANDQLPPLWLCRD